MLKKLSILVLLTLCGTVVWFYSRQKSGVLVSEIKDESVKSGVGTSTFGVEGDLNKSNSEPIKSISNNNGVVSPTEKSSPKANTTDPFDYGKTPAVKGDANAQVKSVVEAIKSGQHPEQLSVMISPKAFDFNAYKSDKSKYLNTIEPGRVFMPAQPGPDVQRIKPVSPEFSKIPQDGGTTLRVQVLPGTPVTYTSFDAGKFSNELTTITVESNEKGIAEAKFLGVSGTIEDVHILCASPLTSGQVRFTVNVTRPLSTHLI